MRLEAIAAFTLLLVGAESPAQDFTYTNINGAITITGYTGPGGNVTIPSTIDGLPVTSVGDAAFRRLDSVSSVTIPDSVTKIEDGGAPEGGAFGFCISLTNATVGSSVTNIGDFAFVFCGRLTGVTVGQSVTRIGAEAFRGCTRLTSIILPNKLVSIEEGAFWSCTSLTNLSFGNVVTNIGNSAFWDCSGLSNMTIPESVLEIGEGAFGFCTNLAAINVNPGNTVYSSVDGVLFNKAQTALIACPGAIGPNYTVPQTVKSIAGSAFSGFVSLTNIAIPNSVTAIGDYAFYYCTSLPRVMIPGSVTSIADFAFEYCTNLTGAYFKGSAPSLFGLYVFGDTTNLTVFYLPGTAGWGSTFGDRPAVLWNPAAQTNDASFGVRQNGFGFNITGTPDIPIVVEATTNLAAQSWVPLQSSTLTNGLIYFSDGQWTNYPGRLYRIRSP
jgi:hypothetical protein